MQWRRAALKSGKWAATILFLAVAATLIASNRFGPQAIVGFGERRFLIALAKGALFALPLERPPHTLDLSNTNPTESARFRREIESLEYQIAVLQAQIQQERLRNSGWIFKPWSVNGMVLLPLWIPLAALALPVGMLWRRDYTSFRRARPGLCRECDYNRRGLPPHANCPECGTAPARG